jgi:DNA-binding PadR family transcriptional regulator
LLEKRYIEKLSLPDHDNAEYERTGHRITEKGEYALERFASQARYFVSSLDEKYEKSENNDLYEAIEANRDLLHFAYY